MERMKALWMFFSNKRRLVLFLVIAVLFVSLCFVEAQHAFAQEKYYAPALNVPIPGLDFTEYPIEKSGSVISIPFLSVYILTVYRYLLSIVVIAATVMFIYGAFLYLIGTAITSIQSGKQIMKDSIVGMLLILASYTILNVVNPDLAILKGLAVETIDTELYFSRMGEGTRPTRIGDDPSISGVVEPATGGVVAGKNEGCVGDQRKYKIGDPIPSQDQLKNFKFFPKKWEDQVLQYGMRMRSYVKNYGLVPEAHAALIRAGEIAKSKGYFLSVFDGFRTSAFSAKEYARRVKETGGGQGMAKPGTSPHELGIAVDLSLFTPLEEGEKYPYGRMKGFYIEYGGVKYVRRAGLAPLCNKKNNNNTVDNTIILGVKWLEEMDAIMAEAGFYRYCQETWHYDYGGVYKTLDCTKCAFPPNPPRGDFKYCEIKYLDRL